jgi:hypothetical protein
MKTATIQYFVIFIFFITSHFAFGLHHAEKTNLYDHLFEVNENWKFHKVEISSELFSFKRDIERIQTHLLLVEKSLRNVEVSDLTKQQLSNRLKTLNILHQYALDGKFPINTSHAVRQPYFIDIYGTHCAVGFLVKETGFAEISLAISEKQNFSYVKEILSLDLVKWSEDFGFTLDELAWIQPGYPPTQTYSQVRGGTNGTVTCSKTFFNRLYIGGNFTEFDSLPCLNVGFFNNNQLNCFGNGIAGKVVGVAEFGANGVIVAGEFESNGVIYPLAKYDGNTWNYIEIPGVPNARATCFTSSTEGLDIKIAVSAPSISNGQEVWFLMGGWHKLAFVPGIIYDMDFSYSYVFAGHFDSIQMMNPIPYWVQAKNFAVAYSGNWASSIDWVPDTIYSILSQGNTVYLGGYAGTDANGTALMRFVNGVAQPLISNSTYQIASPIAVKDIAIASNSSLIVGGDLNINTLFTYGRNLFTYDLLNSILSPISLLDSTVHTIASLNGKFYIGGDFTYNGFAQNPSQPLNYLIYLDEVLNIPEENGAIQLVLSPNPSEGKLTINGIDKELIKSIEILDLQGKICHTANMIELDLTSLNSGTYFVRVLKTDGSTSTTKWVKH